MKRLRSVTGGMTTKETSVRSATDHTPEGRVEIGNDCGTASYGVRGSGVVISPVPKSSRAARR
jgi:hypothetical protein